MSGNESRKGRPASFWVAIFLGVFLAGSLLFVFVLVVSLFSTGMGSTVTAASDGRFVKRTLAGDREAAETIGLVPIRGVIAEGTGFDTSNRGGDTVGQVRGRLEVFEQDPSIQALLVELDTPGGGITASDVIREEILRFKREKRIPVVALMKDVAASGGYYVATACDKIVAHPTTITGSIGVIFSSLNVHGLLEKVGVSDASLISPNTPYKDTGSPFRPMREEERGLLLGLVEEMYQRFVSVVGEGRPGLDEATVRRLADGRIYSGVQAKAEGLVDETGYLSDALRVCRELAGIDAARLVSLEPEPTFLEALFGITSRLRPPVALQTDRLLESLEPRFYYLWTGGLALPGALEVGR